MVVIPVLAGIQSKRPLSCATTQSSVASQQTDPAWTSRLLRLVMTGDKSSLAVIAAEFSGGMLQRVGDCKSSDAVNLPDLRPWMNGNADMTSVGKNSKGLHHPVVGLDALSDTP